MQERVMALAGLAQALKQVRRIAETGQADAAVLATALESVFHTDAASVADVYGGVEGIRPGLRLLHGYFNNLPDDEQLPKLALAVLQLERRFINDGEMVHRVQRGITAARNEAQRAGSSTHPEVLSSLGTLYAETVSNLRPRVMVQGNPHYLGQSDIVSEIRAVLMAALRSAVLWRQMGGNYLDFLLRRKQLLGAVERLLG
ncbi:high frequency lysogenization protein HflD [Luteimonas sp. JM171]|uniref:high frequency lysogenization protein HflD n=1 Tax=Luteimonas sp. JM171 TaxID=1896164 RepID=UPI0008582ADA|nr:high frequency lysogenization protein HflD [Luteimonas sp. JM171]AOH37576.1 lysogenization regulator HflD [Luteimonas sp. JM171]